MSLVDSHSRNLRKGRYSAPGIYYFLTTSVAGRRPIFTSPEPAYIVLDTINWLKSYSATQLVRIGVGAPIWQPGYHDHALRDDEDYGARVRYTLENPVRAGLPERPEAYPYVVLPEWWSDR